MKPDERKKEWVAMVLHTPSAFRARVVAQDIIDKAHSDDKWDAMLEIQKILENTVLEAYTEGHERAFGVLQQLLFEISGEIPTAQAARDMNLEDYR